MAPDLHLLTGAYALDALADDEERHEFERHLADCEDCREEVRGLRETAAELGMAAAATPPALMRARVMARIATTPQLPPLRPSGPIPSAPIPSASIPSASIPSAPIPLQPRRSRGPDRRWLSVAATVVLLAGLAVGGLGIIQLRQAGHDQRVAEQARRQAERVLAIAADPAAKRASGSVGNGGTVTVLSAGTQAAVLTAGLKPLPSDRIYQLWLVRPGETVSGGLGPQGSAGGDGWSRLLAGLRAGDGVAISVEPAGGSAQPSTQPLVVVKT